MRRTSFIDLSAVAVNYESILRIIVLAWIATLPNGHGTSEAGPASRSLADLSGPPSQGFGALAPLFAFVTLQVKAGAGDEGRTRDFLVGNETLYH